MQRFDIHNAPQHSQKSGLRAERRHGDPNFSPQGRGPETASPQPTGVGATGDGLIRSTLKAGAAAAAILVFFVLPSEYGIDPTRVGSLLGLTEMGEIKQQLYAEAAADEAAVAAGSGMSVMAPVSGGETNARLDAIEEQLGAIAAMIGAPSTTTERPPAASPSATVAAPTPNAALQTPAEPAPAETPFWTDSFETVLSPGQGVEVKMAMQGGETAQFEWTANGALLNHDTHGDGGGNSTTYEQGRGVADQQGELTAAFTGNHGWFWRNRTNEPVTLTLRVRGAYQRFITP